MADSETTRADLCRYYSFDKTKVTTVYLGSQFSASNVYVKPQENMPWPRSYLLYLGGFNYRKNVPQVIKAFSKIIHNFEDIDLLIIGRPASAQGIELNALCSKLDLGNRVAWLGFIPDDDLPNFYRWSEAFIYPSLYEGFGLPVLEAMQFGAPVITSDRASIPEIIGNAGIMINPDSTEEIAGAMTKILMDKELRANLTEYGITQAAKFSWEKCADEVLKVYAKVLNKGL